MLKVKMDKLVKIRFCRPWVRSICWDKISSDLKFVDWPTHENHENSCPTNNNDFTVWGYSKHMLWIQIFWSFQHVVLLDKYCFKIHSVCFPILWLLSQNLEVYKYHFWSRFKAFLIWSTRLSFTPKSIKWYLYFRNIPMIYLTRSLSWFNRLHG
jgi:hypothetical protein